MSYINVWIHFVWATYNRQPFLADKIRSKVFDHIKSYAAKKNIHLDMINGWIEHVHCLVSLRADQNIATVANLLKGESSHWINKTRLSKFKFAWQDEYFAVSVSPSQIPIVRAYIRNQELHHKSKSFHQEYDEFMTKFEFKNESSVSQRKG